MRNAPAVLHVKASAVKSRLDLGVLAQTHGDLREKGGGA